MLNEKQKADIAAKVEKMTASFELENLVAQLTPEIKTLAYTSEMRGGLTNFINFKCQEPADFQRALEVLPPINKTTTIGSPGDKYYRVLQTPFKMDLKNQAKPNDQFPNSLEIKYTAKHSDIRGDIFVTAVIPVEMVSQFLNKTERGIYETEHVHFLGMSHAAIKNMRVTAYGFKGQQLSWYGGDITLMEERLNEEIINYLLKAE